MARANENKRHSKYVIRIVCEGDKIILQSHIEQVLDYALDLKNFHLLSQNRIIVPILVPTKFNSSSNVFTSSVYEDSIYNL